MLEITRLDIAEMCHRGINSFREMEEAFIGQTCALQLAPFRDEVISKGENIDTFLCKHLVKALADKPSRSQLLLWYAPHNEFLFITVCDKRLKANSHPWLGSLPGYAESGQDYVRGNAQPFLRWDGKNLWRLYQLPEDYDPGARYISDFGSLFGLQVGPTNSMTYAAIEANPAERWDLSIVPMQNEQIVTVEGKKLVLLHTYWTP